MAVPLHPTHGKRAQQAIRKFTRPRIGASEGRSRRWARLVEIRQRIFVDLICGWGGSGPESTTLEYYPDGSLTWRGVVSGHEAAIRKLRELAAETKNDVRLCVSRQNP